ncbi:MAG: hypothetical protein ACK2T3_04100, partial [Candidatus Promineifilaceae bacterium]
PLMILPLLGMSSSPIIWGRPDDLRRLIWLVTAQIYRPNVLSFPLSGYWSRLSSWLVQHLLQVLLIAAPLIALGFSGSQRRGRRMILAFLGTASLYFIYAFSYRADDSIVFVLPALMLASLSLTFGINNLGYASILLPVLLVTLNFGGQNQRDDGSIQATATTAMQNLPMNAIVITPGDQTATTLLYYQYAEGIRADLIVVDDTMFQFDWYREQLGKLNPSLLALEVDDVPGFIEDNQDYHAVCHLGLLPDSQVVCGTPTPSIREVDPS